MCQRTHNLELTICRRLRLSICEYKSTSSPLHFNEPGTLPTPWMGQLPSLNYVSHQVGEDAKCHSGRTRAYFPGFCVPNRNKTCKHTHWVPGASIGPHELTSCRRRNSFTFISGVYAHTHSTAEDCLGFSRQWNGYRVSLEWQVSGTQETMEYHETRRKVIQFWKGSLRDITVHLHSWNWRHKVKATQGCSSRDFGNEPKFSKPVKANGTTDIPHTLTKHWN
jgi:hypothetical protein